MKGLADWSSGRIFAVSYLPYLTLYLLSLGQPYNSTDRSILLLLGSVWHTSCYAIYLGAIAITLSRELGPSLNREETAYEDSIRLPIVYIVLPIVYIVLPILALFRPLKPTLLPTLPVEHPILLAIVSTLCYFYPAYSTAKFLTTVEHGRPTSFRENVRTCIALTFFPFSIFFTQPRVKQALQADSMENDSSE